MKAWAIDYLACPETGSSLELQNAVREHDDIVSGLLVNAAGHAYPIRDGIPRLALKPVSPAEAQTVSAFGTEWETFPFRTGFIASRELFFSFFPVLRSADIRDAVVLDAGCGNGRWLRQMAKMGGRRIVGLDYSSSVRNSWANTRGLPNVTVVQGSILKPPLRPDVFDLIVSMGVIHHLDDPVRGMAELGKLLSVPRGKITVWLYAHEGNELYLRLVGPLRKLCPHLPPMALLALSRLLALPVWLHAHTLNRWCGIRPDGSFRLPMAGYFDLLRQLTFNEVVTVAYDQLTPELARYYRRGQVDALFREAGLTVVDCATPRGNSYSVAGTRGTAGTLGLDKVA